TAILAPWTLSPRSAAATATTAVSGVVRSSTWLSAPIPRQMTIHAEGAIRSWARGVRTIASPFPAGVFEMIERFEILSRRMRAVRAKLLTRANDGGLWAAHGARSFSAWMATRLGSDRREVNKTVREASALEEHLPKMSAAIASGEI